MKLRSLILQKNRTNIDDPDVTIERSSIIEKKLFLNKIYIQFYNTIYSQLLPVNKKGKIVELGSGGGFMKKIIPNVITTDIIELPDIDMQFSALDMPFKRNSVNAFVMVDVFHHIDNSTKFLKEADRCLKKHGQIIMIEPAITDFGKLIYKYLHHEPYNPKGGWSFASTGPLSGANSALPWIVFVRDQKKFEKKFPQFKIQLVEAHTPLKYLLSGGLSFRQFLPDSMYPSVHWLETKLQRFNKHLGMFYTIVIEKV